MSKPRVSVVGAFVVFLTLGCSSESKPEAREVVGTAEEALLGSSSFDCNGAACSSALETNFERMMKLGRTAARSAAFLECLDVTVRTGVSNADMLTDWV